MLTTPLQRPRITGRRLIAVVAIGALVIWSAIEIPQILDRASKYRHSAATHAVLESEFLHKQRDGLSRASMLRAQLDQLRSDAVSPDPLTERYLASHLDIETLVARYNGAMAEYFGELKDKYLQARGYPWHSVRPDRVPPLHPFSTPAPKGKKREDLARIDGGISLAFFPGGSWLAVGCRDKSIKILEIPSKRLLAKFPLPEGDALSVAFSPEGMTLAAVVGSDRVWQWDMATGHAQPALLLGKRSPGQANKLFTATEVDYSPDGGTLAVAAGSGLLERSLPKFEAVRLLDMRTGEVKWEHKGTRGWANSVVFSPDGELVAYCNGTAVLLDAGTGKLKQTLEPSVGAVLAVAFSPDGRTLAGAGLDTVAEGGSLGNGRVTLWEISTAKVLRTLEGPTGRAQKVAFSPDGRTVAAGGIGPKKESEDKVFGRVTKRVSEVKLWSVTTGTLLWTFEGDTTGALALAFSQDGKSLAFCDLDYLFLIEADTGKLKQIVMETITGYREGN